MAAANLSAVGTNWHTLALSFQSNNIAVFFDGAQQIAVTDNHFDSVPPYTSGGITADMYSDANPYLISIDDVVVRSMAAPPVITSQPSSVTTNSGSTVTFSVSLW